MEPRELYLQQIRPFMNRPFIKVVAGIRRCGKSVVLQLIADDLKRQGIAEERIVYMNFESFEYGLDGCESIGHRMRRKRFTSWSMTFILL